MAEKLFPTRQRCKACGKKLEAIVLDGLYCSYKCAKLPEPYTNLDNPGKGCKFLRSSDKQWIWKQKYRAETEIPEKLLQDASTNVYRCTNCHFLHVGHSRPMGTEKSLLMQDADKFASFLLRTREQTGLTRKQVADKIKVRPIRIKEIEENSENISTEVLFKLLRFYKIKLNVLM